MGIKVLYCGDSPVGGAANYLLGVLGALNAAVTHVPPAERLQSQHLKAHYQVVILSDYSHRQLSSRIEELLVKKIVSGAGLLMVGGWGSFSGPFGGWKNSAIEAVLPVSCKKKDDRVNFPGGASLILKDKKSFLDPKLFIPSPAICGMNDIRPKAGSHTLLAVRRVLVKGEAISFERKEYPYLVVQKARTYRSAALASDLAPHWCGGLVDWGTETRKLDVASGIQIQVGNYYIRFIHSIITWLSGG